MANASLLIFVTLLGKETLLREVQPLNALYTISVTFLEIFTSVRFLQAAKALSEICVTESGIVYLPPFVLLHKTTLVISTVYVTPSTVL